MIYNLWLNDEGIYELNFDEDDEVRFCTLLESVSLTIMILIIINEY